MSICRPTAVLILLLVVAPASAGAEVASSTTEADAATAFRQGGELYSAGQYRQALAEFSRAHELAPHSANLFNMARCHENLGAFARALRTYREALEGTTGAEERADIERRIAGILERPVRVFVTSEPSGATVLVDAREEPESASTPMTLELVPGPHRIILTAEGHLPTAHRVDVVVGEQTPVEVTLSPVRQEACPECDGPTVVERCRRVNLEGLHAHLGVAFPIGIPIVHREQDLQLHAGIGVTAAMTYDHIYAAARFNVHPSAHANETTTGTGGEEVVEDKTFNLFFTALEVGYVWALDVAAFRLSGGIAFLADFWTESGSEGSDSRDLHTHNSLFGWASVGLDVHALRWLSIGLDGGLGAGAGTGGGLGLFGVLAAKLTFHL